MSGKSLRLRINVIGAILPAFLFIESSQGAESGDLDGDGRISIRDVIHLQKGLPPADGSFDVISQWCRGFPSFDGLGFIYMESLRRNVQGSYPNWFPLDPRWVENIRQVPLDSDGRVSLQIDPIDAVGGIDDQVLVAFHITTEAAIRAFSLIFEIENNVIQVPFLKHSRCRDGNLWTEQSWYSPTEMALCHLHNLEGIPVYVMPSASLITGGRYVVSYGIPFENVMIPKGKYSFTVQGRLPKGIPAKSYRVRVMEGSEVVFEDGMLTSFMIENESELKVQREVNSGFDGVVPKINFDYNERRILGKVEFRIVNQLGEIGSKESPLAEVLAGDEVVFRVQMRTEIPINDLFFMINWPGDALTCNQDDVFTIFHNPEDGLLYAPYPGGNNNIPNCSGLTIGRHLAWYRLAGAWSTPIQDTGNNYIDRVFEYFKPLREWTNLTEVHVKVPDSAKSGIIPLKFSPYHRRTLTEILESDPIQFAPYFADWPCNPDEKPPEFPWRYDVNYENTFISVSRFDDPPPPPDAEIEFQLGDVEGAPGDLVELPVYAWSPISPSLLLLRLVTKKTESANITIDAVETWVVSDRTQEVHLVRATHGKSGRLVDCVDENGDGEPDQLPCPGGHPMIIQFLDISKEFNKIDWALIGREYLKPESMEIGRLIIRISPDAPPGKVILSGGTYKALEGGLEIDIFSGGFIFGSNSTFSPARVVHPGVITISDGFEKDFVRGDANLDSQVDLSDAIFSLGYLFLGEAEPKCLRAADANDDGAIEITDPVFLLGALFLGDGPVPAPSPACGPDPTPDALTCLESLCPGEQGAR